MQSLDEDVVPPKVRKVYPKLLNMNKIWLEQYVTNVEFGQVIYFPYLNFDCLFYVAAIGDYAVTLLSYPIAYNDIMWRNTDGKSWKMVNGNYNHCGKFHFGLHRRNLASTAEEFLKLPEDIIKKWYDTKLKLFITLEPRPGIKVGDYIKYTSPTETVSLSTAETGYSSTQTLPRKNTFYTYTKKM